MLGKLKTWNFGLATAVFLIAASVAAFQNCSPNFYVKDNIISTPTAAAIDTARCSAGQLRACSGINGQGTSACQSNQMWGSCLLSKCDANFRLYGTACVANICAPGAVSNCFALNGQGTRTCSADGSAYGACGLTACDSGFSLEGGACSMKSCFPNQSSTCTVLNGQGSHTCDATGTAFGACGSVTCNNGFSPQNGACLANACTPNASSTCSAGNGQGEHTCNANGTDFGLCSLSSCDAGFNLQGKACVANSCSPNAVSKCSVIKGQGARTCNAAGSDYGACVLNACDAGFAPQGGSCVSTLCVANSTSSCSVINGSGSHTCNASGTAFSDCTNIKCQEGYDFAAGTCAIRLQTIYRYLNASSQTHWYGKSSTTDAPAGFVLQGPVFDLYASPASDRLVQFRCYYPANGDRWVASSCRTDQGVIAEETLGYTSRTALTSTSVPLYYCQITPSRSTTTTQTSECSAAVSPPQSQGLVAQPGTAYDEVVISTGGGGCLRSGGTVSLVDRFGPVRCY